MPLNQGDIKILLVEDDIIQAKVMLAALRKARPVHEGSTGFSATHVPRLSHAIEHVQTEPTDVVLLDLMLPDSEGMDTFLRLYRHAPDVPIVVLSGLDDDATVLQALQSGAQDFLVKKDVKHSLLVRSIYLALERHRMATEAAESVKALRESEGRFRLLATNMQDMVCLHDPDGTFRWVSPSVQHLLGHDPEDLIGTHPRDWVHPDDLGKVTYDSDLSALLGDAEEDLVDVYRIRRKDGWHVWFESLRKAIRDEQGTIVTWQTTSRDVTGRKNAEDALKHAYDVLEQRVEERTAELRTAKEVAEEANRAKSMFVANMSHELRTPLNGILGLASLLLNTEITTKQQRYLSMIRSSGDVLLRLINDILDHAKLEAGKLDLAFHPFNLMDVLAKVNQLFKTQAEAKGIAFSYDMQPGMQAALISDGGRLEQVLYNLLGNALKFTEEGSIGVRVKQLEASPRAVTLQFAVWDTGIGIPKEKQDRLFQSFSQVDGSLSRKYGGTGLGLSICRQIVELMGGDIWVESEEGKGTTFYFVIHAERQVDVAEVVPLMPAPSTTAGPAQFERAYQILLVEDNMINREVAIESLEERGARITEAHNGEHALERLQSGTYDIVLMDVQMPGMDGLEATRRFRAQEAAGMRLPIIALTAHAMEEDRQKCFEAGMDAYATKPVDFDALHCLIEEHIQKVPASAEPATKAQPAEPETPLADLRPLLKTMRGKMDRLDRIVDRFLDDYAGEMVALLTALDEGDLDDVERRAHGLKSGLGYLGAAAAQELARQLEHAGNQQDLQEAHALFQQLEQQVEHVAAHLQTGAWREELLAEA